MCKTCKQCNVEKKADEFSKARNVCKKCLSENKRLRYQNDADYRERQKLAGLDWVKRNAERKKETDRARYYADIEKSRRDARERYQKNREAKSEYNKKYRSDNRERLIEYTANWRQANSQHVIDHRNANREERNRKIRKYRKANRHLVAEMANRRRSAKLQADKGGDKEFDDLVFKEAYWLAARRKEVTGFAWHVDHIEPLRGMDVCGLHNAHNIKVIPAVHNLKKGNKRVDFVAFGLKQQMGSGI